MFKKILAALLVAGTVLTLTACNKENTKTPDNDPDTKTEQPSGTGSETGTQTGTEPDEIDYESGLSTEKYDGYNYRILVRKGWLEGQYQEESQEDVIADAIYRRNKEVEERFGITFRGLNPPATTMSSTRSTQSLPATTRMTSFLHIPVRPLPMRYRARL